MYAELWDIFHACAGGYSGPAANALSDLLARIADNIDKTPEIEIDNRPVYDWDC